MSFLADGIFTLFSAAIVSGILGSIGKQTGFHSLLKLLSGVFLMLTLLVPFADLRFEGISPFDLPYTAEASQASQSGEEYTQKALAVIIKQETQAYILDKASAMGAVIRVDVTVSADPVPVPEKAVISGTLTPEQRQTLETMLTNDLNIAKEYQTWIG